MRKELKADLLLLLAAVIWGGGFVAGKMALSGLSPFSVIAWRFGLSSLLCLFVFFKSIRRSTRKIILRGALIGIIEMSGLCIQMYGLQFTTSAKQSFLCTTYVAITPFVSWLILKKRPGINAFMAGILSAGGIGLITYSGAFVLGTGDLLSLCFPILFSVHIVLVGIYSDENTDIIQFTFWQLATAGILSCIGVWALGESIVPIGFESLGGAVYLAVLNTLVAFTLQNYGQRHTKDTTASLIMSLESVFGFLFSVLYYRESLTVRSILGGVLCFFAILLNTVRFKTQSKR